MGLELHSAVSQTGGWPHITSALWRRHLFLSVIITCGPWVYDRSLVTRTRDILQPSVIRHEVSIRNRLNTADGR